MPEGPVTEVFRADLDVNLKAKEALAELDQLNSQIKKAVTEMQTALDSLQFKSPFKTWQSEIAQIGRELAALTMPRAMRFDLPEREIERYIGRIKDLAREYGVSFEEMEKYLQENAEALTKYGRGGAEAFIKAMQDMRMRVSGGSIIPEMVAEIRNTLTGLAGQLGGGTYGPFSAIANWAASLSQDTKTQFVGMAAGIVESLVGMADQARAPIAATAAEADEMLFGLQGRWRGLIPAVNDVIQAFRLVREEGGNVGVGLSKMAEVAGGLIERFGGSSQATQRFLGITDKARDIFGAAGEAIMGFRRTLQGHDYVLDQVARNTANLTEQLKFQADVWRRTSSEAIKASGDMAPYMEAVVRRITGNVSQLDTALKHLTTSFLATGQISAERMQDARDAVRDLTAAMEAARKLGIPLDPKFEARMKEAFGAVRTLAAEEQRLAAGRQKRAEIQQKATEAARQANAQTQQMISYLRPGGPMAAGLSSTNMMLRDGSVAMQRFGLSFGSTLSVVAGMGGILGQLNPAFSAVIVGVAQMADKFIASITAMQSAATTGKDRIRASITALGAVLTGFGTMAMGMVVSTGKLAAEVETLWITVETTAKNIGVPIDVVKEKLESLKDSGITTRESMNALTQFLRAKLPLDQLNELADAAKNVAVTLPQMTSSEVMQRFVWVIQSGNSALLDALGIQKTVNQMVEEYAAKMGLASKALTIRQKQEAIMAGLIGEVSNFQGVYNEAMKTASKQLGSMVRYWEELRLKIGEQFLPIVTEVVKVFSNLLKSMQNMKPETLRLITMITAVTAIFGTLLGVLLLLAPGIVSLISLVGGLAGVIGSVVTTIGGFLIAAATSVGGLLTLGTTVGLVIPIIAGLVAIIAKAIKSFNQIKVEGEGVEAFVNRLKVALKPLIDTWHYFWQEVVMARWPRIQEGIQNIIEQVRGFASEHQATFSLMETAWTVAKDFIVTLMDVIDSLLAGLGELLNFNWEGAWMNFQEAGIRALAWLSEFVQDFVLRAYDWGVNMAEQLAVGLIDAARTAIPTAAEYVGGMLSLFLEGHSPPKAGPLKKIRSWGKGVAGAFGAGMGDVNLTGYMATVGTQFSDLRGKAKDWGRNMVGTFAEGISGKAAEAIAPAMEVVGMELSRFLEGHSPPEAGRLAELQDWGKSAMEAFMAGFSMVDFGVFDTALSMIETRMKQVVGTGKEQAGELSAAMMDMRGRVAEAISAIGAGTAVDVSNLADSIFQNVAVPVKDILQVAQATLQAEAAKDAVKAIQDAATAAKEARRKQIEGIQDIIYAFQEEIEVLNERKEELKEKIQEEVAARQRMMGLVIDPAVLKRLEAELRRASIQVKKQEAELQKYTAYRERLGIDMLSWEEVSLMASLDLARQKESEAQIAVDEERDRVARAKELQEEVESQYQAEFDAIEDRIKQIQKNIKAQQKLLRQLQRADREASRAEQERIKAAQEYAKSLADQAALLKKALQERLKTEELEGKLGELGESLAEEVTSWADELAKEHIKGMGLRGVEPPETLIMPSPSEQLKNRLLELRELLAGGPRAILQALALAVYKIAKPVLAKFGIDLDDVIAKAQQKWSDVKDLFSNARKLWEKALGKAEKLFSPVTDALDELWKTITGIFDDPALRDALDDLQEAWEDLKKDALEPIIDALGDLWDELKPLIRQMKDIIVKTGAWKVLLIPLLPLFIGLKLAIAGLSGFIEGLAGYIEGAIDVAGGFIEVISGVIEIITGLLTMDISKIQEGFETAFGGIEQIISGFTRMAVGFISGFATAFVEALGLDTILEIFGGWVDDLVSSLQEIKDNATITLSLLKTAAFDVVKAAIESVKDTWNWLRTWTSTTLTAFKTGDFDITRGAVDALKGAWDWLRTWTSTTLAAFKTGDFDITKSAVDGLRSAWSWLRTWTSTTLTAGKTEAFDIVKSAVDALRSAWSYLRTWASTTLSLSKGGDFNLVALAVGALRSAWDWLNSHLNLTFGLDVTDAWDRIYGKIYDLWEKLKWIWDYFLGGAGASSQSVQVSIGALEKLSAGLSAGLSIPTLAAGAGTPLTVQYAPVLNFYGPTSPEEVKQAVVEAPEEIDWQRMVRR